MLKFITPAFLLVTVLSGCQSMYGRSDYYSEASRHGSALMADAPPGSTPENAQTEQMLIWTGSMTIEVMSISNAAEQISATIRHVDGYIESSSSNDYGDRPSTTLTARVPSDKLEQMLRSLDGIGEVISKSISSEDVTERYVDMQARLETNKQLRDRLQKLLDRADEVKDVLAIERELTRLQGDIDSMTARLKAMKGRVDYASLSIRLNAREHEKVLGPLGYVWEGATWCVKKLFVWKDASYEQQ
ncbi:DUF4349 domain-containing protein [Pontiellaceae bacterium B12219]|nr:DUF4349 domain-containing protein [Pontiellaceae bacterium B12219]